MRIVYACDDTPQELNQGVGCIDGCDLYLLMECCLIAQCSVVLEM